MKIRLALSVLLLIVAGSPQAEAQFRNRRVPRPAPESSPSDRPANERHERIKIEAQEAYQKGNYTHTVDLTSSVLRQNDRDDVAYYLRGSARVELGKRGRDAKLIREGIADAREAITIKGAESVIYYLPYLYGMTSLAEVENRQEHADVAVQIADKVLGSSRLSSEEQSNLRYQRAMAQLARGDVDAAIGDFRRAVQVNPRHMGAALALGDTYARAGRHAEAAASFDRAVRTFAESPLAYNNRGMYRQQRRDLEGAIADFTKAVELDPTFGVGYTNRGFARLEQGDARGAERDFSASLRANPGQPGVYSFRGTARLAQGRVQAALEDFTALAELQPQNAVAHADVGFARFFAGDYAGALTSFNRAAELNSNLRYLNTWRYWSMAQSGATKEQLDGFADQLTVDAERRDWVDSLVAYLAGRIDEEALLKARDAENEQLGNDQLCEAHFFIGQRETQAGRPQVATDHFEKALDTNSKHLSAFRGAQYALKRFPKDSAQTPGTPRL